MIYTVSVKPIIYRKTNSFTAVDAFIARALGIPAIFLVTVTGDLSPPSTPLTPYNTLHIAYFYIIKKILAD